MADIRNRVKELRTVRYGDLVPNPANWRGHPEQQRKAYEGIVESIGFAGAALARVLDDGRLMLIDGHMRRETHPDAELPVLITDLTEDEANTVLATYDPISAMAQADAAALDSLLRTVNSDNASVQAMLDDLNRIVVNSTPASEDEWGDAFGGLATGDRAPFQQMTFTLHDDQAEQVKRALDEAKAMGAFIDSPNENSNGNALARVCELFTLWAGEHGQR